MVISIYLDPSVIWILMSWSHKFVCDVVGEEKRKLKTLMTASLMTASLMMLESLLVSEILVISVFRVTGVRWSHRFVCDVTSLLVILLVMREE